MKSNRKIKINERDGREFGIAVALKFDYEEDGEALALQNMIKNEGIDKVLDKICGIPRESPLNMLVKDMLKHRFFVE